MDSAAISTAQLNTQGLDSRAIAREIKRGALVRLRPGLYSRDPDASITTCHKAVLSHYLKSAPDSVASHWSAALLHGLVEAPETQGRLWVTREGRDGGQQRTTVTEARAALPASEVVLLDGLPVTSLARTAIDLARSQGLPLGLELMDEVVRREGRKALKAALRTGARRPGAVVAAQAVRCANRRALTRRESRLRGQLLTAGLPQPQVNASVLDVDGEFIAQAALVWPAFGVAGYPIPEGDDCSTEEEIMAVLRNGIPGTPEHARVSRQLALKGWWALDLPLDDDPASLRRQFRDARLLAARLRAALGHRGRWPDLPEAA